MAALERQVQELAASASLYDLEALLATAAPSRRMGIITTAPKRSSTRRTTTMPSPECSGQSRKPRLAPSSCLNSDGMQRNGIPSPGVLALSVWLLGHTLAERDPPDRSLLVRPLNPQTSTADGRNLWGAFWEGGAGGSGMRSLRFRKSPKPLGFSTCWLSRRARVRSPGIKTQRTGAWLGRFWPISAATRRGRRRCPSFVGISRRWEHRCRPAHGKTMRAR